LLAQGSDDEVIALHEYLDWGPIDCPLPERMTWLETHSPSEVGWDWLVEGVERFRARVAGIERPLIWIAPQNAGELSGFHWYLHGADADDAEIMIVDYTIPGGWGDEPPRSLGELSVDRFSYVLEHPPVPYDQRRFARDRWGSLQRQAALLRVVKDGELQSVAADYFDELLLSCIPDVATKWHRPVGDTMGRSWDLGNDPDDSLLKWRLLELARSGRVELNGNLGLYGTENTATIRRL
jgi:hypothetical protein